MSPTTFIFLAIYFTGVILTFKHPYFGIATYIFEWHNHPPYMWWGKVLPDLRWSLLISVVTLISLIINYKKLAPLFRPKYNLIWWLVAMTLWMYFISIFYAINPKISFRRAEIFYKLTIQIFLMMFLIREVKHHKFVIWTLILGVANFGRIAFQRGHNRYLGVIAPNTTEENAVAAHIAATIPFFELYFLIGSKWEKIITALSIPFILNLLILANSRAAFIAVIAIAVLSLIWIKGRLRWRVVAGTIAGILMVLYLANDQFWKRQSTMEHYQDEGSAMSRIYLWKGAIHMWSDHPMGLGGNGFQTLAIQYVPELRERMENKGAKTVHNTILLILVEWGLVGVFIFLGFVIHTFVILSRIRRDQKKSPEYRYYIDAMAIQMGLIAILTAGIFHNRLYSEVVYWFGAFAVALRNIQVTEIFTALNEEDQPEDSTESEIVADV